MRLPEHTERELTGLSDADRFKTVMKRLVQVTPEQLAELERQQDADRDTERKSGPKAKPRGRSGR